MKKKITKSKPKSNKIQNLTAKLETAESKISNILKDVVMRFGEDEIFKVMRKLIEDDLTYISDNIDLYQQDLKMIHNSLYDYTKNEIKNINNLISKSKAAKKEILKQLKMFDDFILQKVKTSVAIIQSF